MTTDPKARTSDRRDTGDANPAPGESVAGPDHAEASRYLLEDDPTPGAALGHPDDTPHEEDAAAVAAALKSVRREGLTRQQLRIARRLAEQQGLTTRSDYDAVRQLRALGQDPFATGTMLEVIEAADKTALIQQDKGTNVPETVPPATGESALARREREITRIQRDIARRRRRKMVQLLTRLSFFVFLPTLLAGYYYFRVATPMYSVKSEFLILQADASAGGSLGGLFSGTQFATNQDSIAVQSYLQSKDAMLRLDQDVGFKSHFSDPHLDPIQRMAPDPSNEAAYSVYRKYVKIGYDPTEGVIKMEAIAADPQLATEFSTHLITYAEDRVDELSRRKREDAVRSAREGLERAKADRRDAQEKLVELQEGTIVDPEAVIGTLRSQIAGYEVQLQEKQLQIAALNDNSRPNEARVKGTQADIDRLQTLLADLNNRMTQTQTNDTSLAAKTAQVQLAQADLSTADLFLQSALQNEKQTEMEANRQVRYLTTSVRPVAPQDPSYPRAFENTLLVLLVLSGVYLMISLTGAILREQVAN
ncbi:capsule biosynthesis protein [Pseudooceanicola spongiae]|uniref:capsule biosynthesis protein n=1 Tax=Pseudooceanicola spongiae TaxID=2613965 RepID=UPI001866C714